MNKLFLTQFDIITYAVTLDTLLSQSYNFTKSFKCILVLKNNNLFRFALESFTYTKLIDSIIIIVLLKC